VRLNVTPEPNRSGTATIEVAASDGTTSVSRTFLLTVRPVNDPPLAGLDFVSRLNGRGEKVAISDLLANDSDLEFDALSLALPAVQAGTKGSIRLVGNWLVYLPPSPDLGETDSFTYTLRDGKGGESVGWVQVRVANAPDGLTQSLLEIAVDPVTKWVTIQFVGIPHRTYEIQRTTSFPGGVWEALGTAQADATGRFGFTDEDPPVSAAYYRSADLTHP
jgi:hypothetical protein